MLPFFWALPSLGLEYSELPFPTSLSFPISAILTTLCVNPQPLALGLHVLETLPSAQPRHQLSHSPSRLPSPRSWHQRPVPHLIFYADLTASALLLFSQAAKPCPALACSTKQAEQGCCWGCCVRIPSHRCPCSLLAHRAALSRPACTLSRP